jgi:peptide/nickel transport system permease protein
VKRSSVILGALILGLIVLPALVAPLLPFHDPTRQNLRAILVPPVWVSGGSWEHALGTDNLGRDLVSRIYYGCRTSLLIASSALIIALSLGAVVGATAALVGGWVETVLMRIVELQIAFPFIVLALAILTVFHITVVLLVLVLVLSLWGAYARTFRGIVLTEKNSLYVLAARAIGASTARIMFNYIFRNILPSILVFATVDLAYIVTIESALSFVSLGVQPPTPSWGNMMGEGKSYLDTGWWIATLPGAFLLLFSFGLNLVVDGLEDVTNIKLTRR